MKAIPYPLRGEWLITADGADLIMGVWETAQSTGKAERIALALEARAGEPFKNERNCTVTPDGIAVMSIDGPLMRKAELFSDISGATSYQWIGATADALRMDPQVKAVIIRANSPGGEAAGCGETADKIARLAAEKHVEGYAETQAASAMYWLLSQCSHITAHSTAQVGWIGAIRTLVDDSKRDEMNGEKKTQIVSKGAEDKRSFPVDDKVIARAKRGVDEWGKLFTDAVAAGRGVETKDVLAKFGRGDGMFAEQALAVGLIDEIGDFESTLARLSGSRVTAGGTYATRPKRGESRMSKPEEVTLAAAPEWQCAGCNEMMGPSAKSFCAKCSEGDDDDGDEDEDEAKALGLEPKSPAIARRERMVGLVELERDVMAAVGATKPTELRARLAAASEALTAVAGMRAELATTRAAGIKRDLRVTLERGLAGAPGQPPRLSLGAIQKTIPVALRGAAKKSWTEAMDKLAADAEAATEPEKKKITAEQIIEAACSVPITAEDLESVMDYAKSASPVAASTHVEPARNASEESVELDAMSQQIKAAADATRKSLDRGAKTPATK